MTTTTPSLLFYFYFWLCLRFSGVVAAREMMIQRACAQSPELSFCREHITPEKLRAESAKKHDVFLRWAYIAAKDAQDIEEDVDTDELETSRKKLYSVHDYCTKYKENFGAYCNDGNLQKLEGLLAQFCVSYMRNCNVAADKIAKLGESSEKTKKTKKEEEVFPTPTPLSTPSPTNYCQENDEKYKKMCEKEGFSPDAFCNAFKKQCGARLEKVDDETTKSVEDVDLSTPEEFETKKEAEKIRENEEKAVEGQGATPDEVTAYCGNYIENYNFYCVGDMAPEHKKFCDSYKSNCPDRIP